MEYKELDYRMIGSRVKQCRENLKLCNEVGQPLRPTQENLLNYMKDKGLPVFGRNTLSKLENGEVKAFAAISLQQWLALCSVFGCSIGYLLGEYDCHNFDIQFIKDETGLDEDAIRNIVRVKALNEEYISTLSAFVEDANFEYFLYLIWKRIHYTELEEKRKNIDISNKQKWHDALKETEIDIPFDGSMLLAKKTNLLDSLISTSITSRMQEITKLFISKKEDKSNG